MADLTKGRPLPVYEYKCDHCLGIVEQRRPLKEREVPLIHENCSGDGRLYRGISSGVHIKPVPGLGTWRYARKLEEKAERVNTNTSIWDDLNA